MKVLIVGGGVIGLLSALELSQAGCDVTILDKQDFGQAASWAGGGILSPMYPWRYPDAVNQLARFGKFIYQQWQPLLQQATGLDIEINPSGMLILDEADFNTGLGWATHDRDPQQSAQLLSDSALSRINPRLNPHITQGLWFPQLANIRNPRLLKTLIAFLKQQPNVRMQPFTTVQRFEVKNNKICAVVDDKGTHWQADQYVIATGAWSGLLSEQFDWHIPVKPIQGQMILFKAPAQWLPTMVMHQGIYLIPRLDGHIVCGSSTDDLGFNTDVNTEIGLKLQQTAYQLAPGLQDMPIVHAWAGLRPGVPDGVPYIGKAPLGQSQQLNNLWLNCGHFRNGLVMAPASARLLKQQMLGEALIVDEAAYLPANRLS
ncbi:glycine oxidase ThiO [Alkanindiges illinoisensis]|uniref:glycine oxidase ThiO n=1 Tax=Alkanindiges illinoisensis TaxID=197183 RepID=UPI00047E07EB|nr:glycine oxidase ThiO [Alkanindiges illinoisensis]